MNDRPREECGVFGIIGHPEAVGITHLALYALQHRGQESAGIAVASNEDIACHKGMGLVSEVFGDRGWQQLSGLAAIGHVRYSTFGSSEVLNAQPLVFRYRQGPLALAHNGNLVNARRLRTEMEEQGSIFQTGIDTEVVAHLIARMGNNGIVESVARSLDRIQGGYSLVLLTSELLLAARDPMGIRPLALGELDGCPVVASETCAFDVIGARTIGDVEPGELVVAGRGGVRRNRPRERCPQALCVFEYIYFARPDSNLRGQNVHAVRKELGRRLAREFPVEADLVTGVPDSSLSAASGYAEEAGIPYELGLVKNRYIGRTFIQPTPEQRMEAVRIKLNPLRKVVDGKRVVLVDDSLIRGTTSRHIVRMLRDAGATEVHLRISSPPYRHPCYYGIDTAARKQLVAASRSKRDIEDMVGADSLEYLSLGGLVEAAGGGGFCLACFDGDYPVDPAGTVRHRNGGRLNERTDA